jgi:putative ABC transport system ATP-binding protein
MGTTAIEPVLEAEGVTVTLQDGTRVFRLEIQELELEPGAAVALTGPSGTGKTLLLEVFGLLRRPDTQAGRFRLRPRGGGTVDLAELWTRAPGRVPEVRGGAFGFIPQHGGLLPFLTLGENIALGQQVAGRPDPGFARSLAERLGIADILGLRPDRLSIGQRQRGVIAAALAHRPAVVIADEPTAALDPGNAAEALGLIVDMATGSGAAVLVSSHDIDLVDRFTFTRRRLAVAPASLPDAVTSRLLPRDPTPPVPAAAGAVP